MKTALLFLLLGNFLFAQAQKNEHDWFYSIAVGVGIGHSPSFEETNNGLGAMIDFTLQKNRSLLILGYRATGEAQLLAPPSPSHTMSSVDLLYGRVLSEKKLKLSANAGIGLATTLERGPYLYSEDGLFGQRHFVKLRRRAVALPVSAKALLSVSPSSRVGLEGYVNINSLHNFYGLNLVASFGKYALRKKKKSV